MAKKKTATAVAKLEPQAERRLKVFLAVVLALDVLLSMALLPAYGCVQSGVSVSTLFAFTQCAGTEVLLSVLRVVGLVAMLQLCAKFGAPPKFELSLDEPTGNGSGSSSDLDEQSNGETDFLEGHATGQGMQLLSSSESRGDNPNVVVAAAVDHSVWWRRVAIIATFLLLTLTQLELGVKGVLSPLNGPYASKEAAQLFFCVLIVCSDVELFIVKRLIDSHTAEEGILCRVSHAHRLFGKRDPGRSRCDRCHLRVVEDRCYNCASCNFDVCMGCLRTDLRREHRQESAEEGDDAALFESEADIPFKDYLRQIFSLLKPQIPLVSLALLFVLIRNVSGILLPSYTGKILDSVVRNDASTFKTSIILFVSFNAGLGTASALSKLLFGVVFQNLDRALKTKVYKRLLSQNIEYFDNASTGDLLVKVHDDTRMMLAPVQTYLASVLGYVLSLVGGFIMCVRTSFRLSILAFTILGPLSMVVYTYAAWASLLYSSMRGLSSAMTDSARESFSLIRTVRAFGREASRLRQYFELASAKRDIGVKEAAATAGTEAFRQYLELSLQALVLAYGGWSILSGSSELTVGGLITFQLYWSMLSGAFQGLSDQLSQFTRASGAAHRVLAVLERLPEVDSSAGVRLDRGIGDIELEDVWFRYKSRPDNMVLKGASLKIRRGSICALVGRSGGGKSTIVSLLCGNYAPCKGRITVGGVDLADICMDDYRKRIGLVQQDSEIFNASIEENIVFSVEDYTNEELHAAAERAHCLEFIKSTEDGFGTKVGERGIKISGGQRQRLAIARVMMRRAEFLLLDEATASLDSESEQMVQKSLDHLMLDNSRPTILLVAHRLSTVMNADVIAVVEGGKIVEQGSHAQLLQLGGIYSKLVEKQVKKLANSLQQDEKEAADSVDKLFDEVHGIVHVDDNNKKNKDKDGKGKKEKKKK